MTHPKTDIIEIVGEKFKRRLSEEISIVNQHIVQLRAELKEDNAILRAELKKDNASLRSEFKNDNASLRTELSEKISASHANLIKWMFIFWVGQVVTILGVLFVFFR
ncbi:MAG: hypothetical protein JJU13_02135 [Balneolaceae bacterium]|nr:hypothetical protein [Balneolaceae bacterium]